MNPALVDVIDTSKLSGSIKFGAVVTLVDEDTEEEQTYRIVGEPEADIEAARKRMSEQGFNPVFRVRDLEEAVAEFRRRTRDRDVW